MAGFGIMTAPSQVSDQEILRVWPGADGIGEIAHARPYPEKAARWGPRRGDQSIR
ncbi:MAG: hypothetical protein ABW000_23600 [Actinoplanes sp.]